MHRLWVDHYKLHMNMGMIIVGDMKFDVILGNPPYNNELYRHDISIKRYV